jgi:small ligand-binding sensory domain FIST
MAISTAHDNDHWADALAGVGLGEDAPSPAPDLGMFFASPLYPDFQTLIELVHRRSASSVLVGCTGHGVIGAEREIEGRPGVSMLNLSLPNTELFPHHIEDQDFVSLRSVDSWRRLMDLAPERVNAFVVIGDPYTFDAETFIEGLSRAYPDKPIAGGLASGLPYRQSTWLFLNDQVYRSGAVVVGIGGSYTVKSVLSAGTIPIGRPWTITGVERNSILTVEGKTAYEALEDTLSDLSDELRDAAIKGVMVGLADGEPGSSQPQGAFLSRAMMGTDRRRFTVTLNAPPRVGQIMQFQVHDADAASANLRSRLRDTHEELAGRKIAGALICSGKRRGAGLFGVDGHDAQAVLDEFGPIPLGGLLTNGEIGTDSSKTILHGSTAGLAFFVRK